VVTLVLQLAVQSVAVLVQRLKRKDKKFFDESGVRIAEVQKTLYIRRKKAKPFPQ
jgi:hypothetical protein